MHMALLISFQPMLFVCTKATRTHAGSHNGRQVHLQTSADLLPQAAGRCSGADEPPAAAAAQGQLRLATPWSSNPWPAEPARYVLKTVYWRSATRQLLTVLAMLVRLERYLLTPGQCNRRHVRAPARAPVPLLAAGNLAQPAAARAHRKHNARKRLYKHVRVRLHNWQPVYWIRIQAAARALP